MKVGLTCNKHMKTFLVFYGTSSLSSSQWPVNNTYPEPDMSTERSGLPASYSEVLG